MEPGDTLVHRAQSLKALTLATKGSKFGFIAFCGQSKERIKSVTPLLCPWGKKNPQIFSCLGDWREFSQVVRCNKHHGQHCYMIIKFLGAQILRGQRFRNRRPLSKQTRPSHLNHPKSYLIAAYKATWLLCPLMPPASNVTTCRETLGSIQAWLQACCPRIHREGEKRAEP